MVIQDKAIITNAHFQEAKQSAYALLDKLNNSLLYHRKEHTTDSVVSASLAIAEAEGFSLEDRLLVGIAAAFHDTGFVRQYILNESIGAMFAEKYMRTSKLGYTEKHIQIIKDAIENTNMKNLPKTKYARVLRDADLAIIGHPDFFKRDSDLREEYKLHPESSAHKTSLSRIKWAKSQLRFISQTHNWFTNGARLLYDKVKQQNIVAFKKHYQLK